MRKIALPSLSLLAAVCVAGAAAPSFHFALAGSVPADKATVHEVTEVRLTFTQEPSEGTVAARLLDAAGEPVPGSDPAKDAQDGKTYAFAPAAPLKPGAYTVSWRGMGADGHVVRGSFSFDVQPH